MNAQGESRIDSDDQVEQPEARKAAEKPQEPIDLSRDSELAGSRFLHAERVTVVETERSADGHVHLAKRCRHLGMVGHFAARQNFRADRPRILRVDVDVSVAQRLKHQLRPAQFAVMGRADSRIVDEHADHLTEDDRLGEFLGSDLQPFAFARQRNERQCEQDDCGGDPANQDASPASVDCWAWMKRVTNASAGASIKFAMASRCTTRPSRIRTTSSEK